MRHFSKLLRVLTLAIACGAPAHVPASAAIISCELCPQTWSVFRDTAHLAVLSGQVRAPQAFVRADQANGRVFRLLHSVVGPPVNSLDAAIAASSASTADSGDARWRTVPAAAVRGPPSR